MATTKVSATAYHAGKFLHEHELLPESQSCPWCNFAGNRPRKLLLQKNPDVWLLSCPACHAASTSRTATQAAIADYYASYYEGGKPSQVTCGNPGHHARHILRQAGIQRDTKELSILDFGGGDGSIGYAVAGEWTRNSNLRAEVVVVDYNERLLDSRDPQIFMSRASGLEALSDKRRFDLVIASAVIEHLPEPVEATRKLLLMLAPGGCLYARTPYVLPIFQILSRAGIPYDFTFPAHFHDLGPTFWANILKTLKLDSGEFVITDSRPSLVESIFADNFTRTLLSNIVKAPWWVFRNFYPFVGGWEAIIARRPIKSLRRP